MTCIIGMIDGDSVVMGGDSAGVDPTTQELDLCKQPKVFINGPYILGSAGAGRWGQILRHASLPPCSSAVDIYQSLAPNLVELAQTHKIPGGWTTLVGVAKWHTQLPASLYQILSAGGVNEVIESWMAIGCGAPAARGALAAFKENKTMSVQEKVFRALNISEHYSIGVRGPFIIERLTHEKA